MKKYLFIAAFLVGAQKLGAQLVIGDNPKQPKAPGKSLLELNNKESDGNAIPGGLLLPKRKNGSTGEGSASTDDVTGFSEGALVYNDKGYFEILTVKNPGGATEDDKKLEWKQVASGTGARRPELINVTRQVSSLTDGSSSGSNKSITITLPDGYVPYTRDGSSSSGTMKQVVVKISYNGFGLRQKLSTTTSSGSGTDVATADFEAVVVEDDASSGSGTGKKVKITFLTLQPEQVNDFDRILVQAIRT